MDRGFILAVSLFSSCTPFSSSSFIFGLVYRAAILLGGISVFDDSLHCYWRSRI